MDKTSQLFSKIILMVILIAAIVYNNYIPSNYINFFYNLPGRLTLMAVTIVVYEYLGLAPALLVALLSLLLIAGGIKTYEGFASDTETFSSDIDIVDGKNNKKWWDEVLLGRETIINNHKVDTLAVQG
jgi:hypothetical protein